ncbi:hypothetical protein M758_5G174500 [Ceratodon purpureus]|nr:hypothetical protein M758_5G174500 [Ceratodon purpureus]
MAEHETEPALKRRCLPQPVSKHTIFLSHSGNEKAFAEQLCEDLKRMNHYPFFDQDSDSLPKGDRFPSLIFSAVEQCLLAVVVLSEGYLSSKWPMLELSTFVKSMKGGNPNLKLFPVFYKLSPSDITEKKVKKTWTKSWKTLVLEGKVSAEEISSWSDAVLELRAFNGLEFSKLYGTSEVKYRAAVVEEICNNVPPLMKYKTDDIRGCDRLCEITSRMFEEGTSEEIICREGCYYLGLYGLGGVGKTTLCKAMCSYFQKEYGSRVCYVELPSDAEERSAERDRISRLKSVIQGLTGCDTRIVDRIHSESQGLECLQSRLRGQPPVFLAVDNVGDSECSRDEARGLVKTVFATGSKVMVTSRSRAILKSILHEEKYCKPISRLERHEARELFLSVAAPKKLSCPLLPFEDEIVKACLEECQFEEVGYATRQYHPLVVRALGSYFHDVDEDNILNWKKHIYISVENKLQGCRETKQVNNILGLNYSSLLESEKLVFLDVALLLNVSFTNSLRLYWDYVEDMVGSRLEVKDYEWRVSFIATLHGISPVCAERKLKELQQKSLIYEASPTLGLHDLYMEFAQSLVMREGSREKEWWVHSKNWAVGMNFGVIKRMTFGIMHRFCLDGGEAKIFHNPKQLQLCEKLECLTMVDCRAPQNFSLDLGGLESLRMLILNDVAGMVEIVCNWKGDGDEGCLRELRIVQLYGENLKRIPFVSECYNLRSLSIKVRDVELVDFIHSVESKIFEKLKALEVLSLCYFSIEPRKMQVLEVSFDDTTYKGNLLTTTSLDVSLLGGLPMLSTLSFHLCDSLEVQGLDQLSELRRLELRSSGCNLEGVDQLSQLTTLHLGWCKYLCKVPNLDVLPNLREVCVTGCCSLEDSTCPWENYEKIKHPVVSTKHQCHQPFCNQTGCKVCLDRHRRSGVTCEMQVFCEICDHLKNNPAGCMWYHDYWGCIVCELML